MVDQAALLQLKSMLEKCRPISEDASGAERAVVPLSTSVCDVVCPSDLTRKFKARSASMGGELFADTSSRGVVRFDE